ncbi:MAG: hypothetical protein OEW00_02480 [candidate division Zixibacteria bacterium]|nr:hypothetical protein [candidate division Zixibacteria bacterium]
MKKSRAKEQIFAEMHRELRRWNPAIPESAERMDAILRILLELYAYQLEQIDRRVDQTWQVAVNSLIKSMVPESRKWPVPAYTVLQCEISDPVVEIDPHTRFFYKEKRESGRTFFFSSQKTEKLISAEVRHLFIRMQDTVLDLSPGKVGDEYESGLSDQVSASRVPRQVYVAVDYNGMPSDLKNAKLYLDGSETVLKQLCWGYWYPSTNFGGFYEDSGFCPGLTGDIARLVCDKDEATDWGGLRRDSDLFKALEYNFVVVPEQFSSTWELGPPDPELATMLDRSDIKLASDNDHFYWIRVDLPEGGDKKRLKEGFGLLFNCFVATNKNALSTYKYTGGYRLVEVELPEPVDTILEITGVEDSDRNDYLPLHKVQTDRAGYTYTLEERGNRLVLWFDFSSRVEAPPDYVTINYTVTAGVAANGIDKGQVSELYEKHPGVAATKNVIPSRGAIPAKTEQQIIAEVSSRLRNRDRVLSFQEIATWATIFDPRVKKAECDNSVERGERGIRRCIRVKVGVSGEDFYSDDETALLKIRLAEFLKSRSPVNTNYQIEVIRG